MAGKKPKLPARARGLRTLQHQTLPPRIRDAIETEVWMRSLLARRAPSTARHARWATKDQVHDEAIGWFLRQQRETPQREYPARRHGDADLTFWVDSRLMQQVRRHAQRDGVKVSRFIEAALSAYVRHHMPSEFMSFRERVELEAERLYGSVHGAPVHGAPVSGAPRRGPA
jgi:phage gp46-like protein